MKHTRSLFDVEDYDEAIRETKIELDLDPENYTLRGFLLMLIRQKQEEEKEYSPKNPRKRRNNINSPSAPARLRAITDKNLVKFSQLCGIKYETYRAIERETKKRPLPPNAISRKNAELIALATGVCPRALMENRLVCADGKTEYDYYVWHAFSVATRCEHKKLQNTWLNLFQGAVEKAIRYDDEEYDNNSFMRVVRLALLIDEFQDIHDKPTEKGKRRRLVSALLESTSEDFAKAAIKRSADIRELASRRSR